MTTSMADFQIEKTLGKGSFGSVYLVTRKEDKKIYAIKTVILEKLNKKEQENSVNEVRILASINHPNVIGYKEAFWNDKESSLNIVMEYADDGDLQTKIQKMRKEGGMFNENIIWSYSIQMIEGLKALHDKKIMHRDLKSANIFLLKDKHQCKLGDMNVSKVIKDKVLLTQTGTPYYASPEVWNDKPYSYKSDLWSIGCVIYELCALHPPFSGKDLDELYENVCKGKIKRINPIYSDELWKMIKMLLQVDVNKRVDCDQLLNSKLIIKKKNELKQNNRDFNYLENKLEENKNNGVLLSTIKFANINEIKSQLPKNKNYKDENIDDTNKNNNLNFNNIINDIKYNHNINYDNNFIRNIRNIIASHTLKNNNLHNNRNNRMTKSGKSLQSLKKITTKKISSEKTDYNGSYKYYKISREKYQSLNCNKDKIKTRNQIQAIPRYSEVVDSKKLIKQICSKKEIKYLNKTENKSNQNNTHNNNTNIRNKEFTLNEYGNSENLKKVSTSSNNNERFKTELQKEKKNYLKINQYNKINPKSSIPISKKKSSTSLYMNNVQNISKLKNESNSRPKRPNNYSYLKIDESKINKYKNKYNIHSNKNSLADIRSKTPIIFFKNNNRLNNDIFSNYNYYSDNYNKLTKRTNYYHQKSVGYLKSNLKNSINEKDMNNSNNLFCNSKNHNCSKSISNINNSNISNIGAINNSTIKNEIKKRVISCNSFNKIRPVSALLSKRLKDLNSLNINHNRSIILGHNYNNNNAINENNANKKKKYVRSSNSYYNLINNSMNTNNINNSKTSKAMINHSTMNINFDKITPNNHCSPIKHRNTYINNKYKKIPTSLDTHNTNHIYSTKKLVIKNIQNFKSKMTVNYNEKNIKKINNLRNNTPKRTFDNKSIRERKKRNIRTNRIDRDLTEPELMMIFNSMKNKENIESNYNNNNKKKHLNISLNDNMGQNNFLKQVKQVKNTGTNNIRLNQYFSSNTNNTNINNNANNKNVINDKDKEKGTQIFNKFYSINNIGNYKIPVKVINIFN